MRFRACAVIVFLIIGLAGCRKDNPVAADTQSPTTVIRFPENDTTLQGGTQCVLRVEASDNQRVVRVDIFLDSVKLTSIDNPPYEYTLDIQDSSCGRTIAAKAYDAAGNCGTASIHITIQKMAIPQEHPPVFTSAPTPAPGAKTIPIATTLTWKCVDPDGGALKYDVYFDTNYPPAQRVASGIGASSLSRSGLWNNSTYYWQVVATNARGVSSTSEGWYFTTLPLGNRPPVRPDLLEPAYNATIISSGSHTLSWSCYDPDEDTVTYDVYLGTTEPPSTQIAAGRSERNVSVSDLLPATTYYWRVVARDNKGAVTEGPDWPFTTARVEEPTGDYLPLWLGKEFRYNYSGYDHVASNSTTTKDAGTQVWKVVDVRSDDLKFYYDVRNIRMTVDSTHHPLMGPDVWVVKTIVDTVNFTISERKTDHLIEGLPGVGSGLPIYRYHLLSDGETITQAAPLYFTSTIKLNVGATLLKYSWQTNNTHIYIWTLQ